MRLVVGTVALGAAILLAACSSSAATSPPTTAPESGAPASAGESAPASAESAAPSAAASAAQSAAAGGSANYAEEYGRIAEELSSKQAQILAKLGTATSPDQVSAVYKEWATAVRASIAEYRKIDWPASISGDMDKLLTDEDSLVAIFEKVGTDATAIEANQAQITQLTTDMSALSQKIAGEFGAP